MRFFMASLSGPIELPSPKISSVTPCRISPCDRPSASSESVDHDSMLMKPGATASPAASIVVLAGLGGEIADARDAVAADADVGAAPRRAGAVVDRAAADDDVESRRGRGRGRTGTSRAGEQDSRQQGVDAAHGVDDTLRRRAA